MKPTLKQSILGPVYTLGNVQILFPRGGTPKLIMGERVVTFYEPSRFGTWATPKARREYITAFYKQSQWNAG